MNKLFLIAFLSMLFFSCNKKVQPEVVYGYEYYPYTEGQFNIYNVQSILHDDAVGVHDTTLFQIKEVIGEEDEDGEGEKFRKIYRYIRTSDTLSWGLKDVWTLKKSNRSIELVAENNRIIKMAFAISYEQYWDCNALNNENKRDCYYSKLYEPYSINSYAFDQSVTVERQDFSSFIEQIREFEVYAADVGMVYSHYKNININNGDTLDISTGSELYFSLIENGFE